MLLRLPNISDIHRMEWRISSAKGNVCSCISEVSLELMPRQEKKHMRLEIIKNIQFKEQIRLFTEGMCIENS